MSEHNHGFEKARFTKKTGGGVPRVETLRLMQDGCVLVEINYIMGGDNSGHTHESQRRIDTETFSKDLAASGYEEEL